MKRHVQRKLLQAALAVLLLSAVAALLIETWLQRRPDGVAFSLALLASLLGGLWLERRLATARAEPEPAQDEPGSERHSLQPDVVECPELEPGMARSRKLVQLFLSQIPGQLDALEQAIDAADFDLLEQHAHKLKGSCLAVGAQLMASGVAALQQEAQQRDAALARRRVAMARERFESLAGLLLRERPSLAPPRGAAAAAPAAHS